MKIKLTVLFAGFLLSSQVFSATYTFNNLGGSNGHGIVDASLNPFRGGTDPGQVFTGTSAHSNWVSAGAGSTSVGIFSTDDLAGIGNTSTLLSLFTPLGGVSGQFSAGAAGARGLFVLNPPAVAITGSQFANQNMYFIAGNASSLELSTEFVVLKHNALFDPADDATPTAINIVFSPDTSAVLFGSVLPNVPTTNTDSSITAGWQMAVIPEPSTALLGLIGALGLLRRRR